MFERFTYRARRIVVISQEVSRQHGHNFIDVSHMLLALIHESEQNEGDAIGIMTLRAMKVDIAKLQERIEAGLEPASCVPSGHIPFTPIAKKVLELSLREALQLGHYYVGSEHLLLGIIREDRGSVAAILKDMGIDLDNAREQVATILARYGVPSVDMPTVSAPTPDPMFTRLLEIIRERTGKRLRLADVAEIEAIAVELTRQL